VTELEKASSVQPNNPLLLASLGQAYLGAGQTQKGMAAFDKAITIAPTPLVWNNVAYSMAEQDTELKRANGYSDAAIGAVETQLRDVSLASLRFPDLGNTQLLFNLWDTKGWVLFKSGDIDQAEGYILPAWQGTQSGAVAEHMGDIALKRGQREQAVRWYVMSLTGENPSTTVHDKLKNLGVSGGALEGMVAKARKDAVSERTFKLDAIQSGAADFFLLVSPTGIEDVKFIKGEESLKPFADMLKKVSLPVKFPPSSKAHVVRRIRLSCGKPASKANGSAAENSGLALPGPCSMEWIPAGDVRSLD